MFQWKKEKAKIKVAMYGVYSKFEWVAHVIHLISKTFYLNCFSSQK